MHGLLALQHTYCIHRGCCFRSRQVHVSQASLQQTCEPRICIQGTWMAVVTDSWLCCECAGLSSEAQQAVGLSMLWVWAAERVPFPATGVQANNIAKCPCPQVQ